MASIAQPLPKRVAMTSKLIRIWPAVLVFYSFLIPPEIALYAGPLRLGGYRLALIAVSPVIFIAILHKQLRFHPLDMSIIIVSFWLPLSFAMNYNWSIGLEAGGSQGLDIFLAYFLGRVTIRSIADLRSYLIYILPGLIIAGALLLLESLSGALFVRQTLQSVFGGSDLIGNELRLEVRMGLVRAYGLFIHPISGGIFMASFISLYFLSFRDIKRRYSGVLVGFLGFFTLSSAAFLCILLNIAFVFFDWIQRRVRELSWSLVIYTLSIVIISLQLFSKNGVVPIIYRYLTLNPATGYFRTLIWQYAGADAFKHPWFGLGYEEYTRPSWMGTSSIDAHYLFMAVSYGMVPALIYFFLAVSIIAVLGRHVSLARTSIARNAFLALAISLTVTLILMFTVTFWGATLAWFNLTLGISLGVTTWTSNLSFGLTVHSSGRRPT